MLNFKFALTSFLFFISFFCFSQRDNTYTIDASTVLGSETTPFWMRANKFGKVPTKGQTAAIFAGINSDYQNFESKIDWGYGLNIGGFAGMENKFIIQQAFVKAKWRAFELYAGRREEIQGLVDTTLSSGSYIWSGNTLPMPKIDLSIPNYTPVGRSGVFSIKGNYAHGWFDSGRADASGIYLHQKSFYGRVGKQNWKFKLYGGFNHQAQWGGTAKYKNYVLTNTSGKFGASFKDYLSVIQGKSNVNADTSKISTRFDAENRTGNHLGSIDLGFEFNYPKFNLFIYRQNIFEDGSLFYLNNINDGLNGLSIAFKNNLSENFTINKITFEFLNTLSQGGIQNSGAIMATLRGQDQYFNNGQYRDGWSYNKTSIGTPFILSKNEFPANFDQKNVFLFTNNRVQVYHLGIKGSILKDYNFVSHLSYSKNWGMYGLPFFEIKDQTSLYLRLDKNINQSQEGINGFVVIAGDIGNLLDSNFAVQLGIKKTWGRLPFLKHPTHKHSAIH